MIDQRLVAAIVAVLLCAAACAPFVVMMCQFFEAWRQDLIAWEADLNRRKAEREAREAEQHLAKVRRRLTGHSEGYHDPLIFD